MDISKITDVKELKAIAYDLLAQQQQTEANLVAVNNRIAELNQPAPEEPAKKK